MRKRTAVPLIAIVAAALTAPLQAHHSFSMFDVSTPIRVKGRVVSYEPIAPHAMIALEETKSDGRIQQWIVEGPWPGRMNWILRQNRMQSTGEILEVGDEIEVCGFDLHEDLRAGRSSDYPEDTQAFVHGLVLVPADGRMQSWNPYGRVDNCIRADDDPGRWSDFFNGTRWHGTSGAVHAGRPRASP